MVYEPAIPISTGLIVSMGFAISPLQKSVAVAPASVYTPPHSTVTAASPTRVNTGTAVSTTVTVRFIVIAAFAEASLTL